MFIITITAPNPIIRVSAGVILRSGRALVSEISFSRWLNFSPPPLCNEKNFSSKPRSDFFEQSKGVRGHFVHICYTHMSHVYFLYLGGATPPNSFAHSSPTHGAIPKAAFLHVQVGSHGSKPSLEPKLKAARY